MTTHAFSYARDGSLCGGWSDGDELFNVFAAEAARNYLDGHFTCRACLSAYPEAEAIVLAETREKAQALRDGLRVQGVAVIHRHERHSDCGAACGHFSPGDRFSSDDVTCPECCAPAPADGSGYSFRLYARVPRSFSSFRERSMVTVTPAAFDLAMGDGALGSYALMKPDSDLEAQVRRRIGLAEQGRGIVDVPSVPQRPVATVGYDDPTGDDVAADVGPRWRR